VHWQLRSSWFALAQKTFAGTARAWLSAVAYCLFIASACWLMGCGGGLPGGDGVLPPPDRPPVGQDSAGSALFVVAWPADSGELVPAVIPRACECIAVTIGSDEHELARLEIDRPRSAPWTREYEITSLPVSSRAVLEAVAYPEPECRGTPLARVVHEITIPPDGPAFVAGGGREGIRLDLESTIARLELVPGSLSLGIGESQHLGVSAVDAEGNAVFIRDDALTWRVAEGSDIVSLSLPGEVTACAPGRAVIEVTEEESGVTAQATVNVTATLGDMVRVSMNLDIFDIVRNPNIWDLGRFDEEVRQMMAQSAAAGVQRILYRVTACGEVMYPSSFLTVFNGTVWGPDNGAIYSERTVQVVTTMRPLETCVRYAHEYGMEIWAWVDIFDRGYSAGGLWDDFLRDRPEYWWRGRSAELPLQFREVWFGMPCNAYPEVRERQVLEIVELNTAYDIDGVFLSVRKHGSPPDSNELWGYNPPVLSAFEARWSEDPRVVDCAPGTLWGRRLSQLQADHTTQLVREIHDACPGLPLMMMRSYLTDSVDLPVYVDLEAMCAEGLVDEVCLYGVGPISPAQGASGSLPSCIWHRYYSWSGNDTREDWVRSIGAAIRSAARSGVASVTLHEQCGFEERDMYQDLAAVLSESIEAQPY